MALLPVLVALFAAGCGGGGGDTTPAPSGNTISGRAVVGGTGLAGVAMTVVGTTSGTVSTDAGGNFQTGAVANGNYTVTPSKAGYIFVPASQAITVANGSVSVPQFTATAANTSYTVSGQVKLNGAGLAGVTVTLSGAGTGSATTDTGGNYSFSGVANGSCTVTASLAGYSFTPLNQVVTVAGGNVSVPDFSATATATSYTISGRVALNGTGVAGVTVTISGGAAGSAITDAGGNYSFTGVPNGTYTIIPVLSGYTFLAPSRQVTVNGAGSTGQDFSAVPSNGGTIIIDFG